MNHQLSIRSVFKTIKEHNCWGCGRKFPAGAAMKKTTSVDGGEISSVYWCKDCIDFMNTLEPWQLEDGFAYGDLLNYDEYRDKIIPRAEEVLK